MAKSKKTSSKSSKGINLGKRFNFSKTQALIIAAAAAIGGYLIYHSFAATPGKIVSVKPPVAILGAGSNAKYWVVAQNGGVFAMNSAPFKGAANTLALTQPITAATRAGSYAGYWLLGGDGHVFAYGVGYYGGETSTIAGFYRAIVPTQDDKGYWLIGAQGQMFAHGDAATFNTTASTGHNSIATDYKKANTAGFGALPGLPAGGIVAAVRTSTSRGLYLLAQNGAVYAYGDAVYRAGATLGSGEKAASIAAYGAGSTGGYIIASSKGKVYRDNAHIAPVYGDLGGAALNGAIVSIAYTPGSKGYWMAAADGGVFAYGNAVFSGSVTVPTPPASVTNCRAPGVANNAFPCAASTGVPATEVPRLTAYTGPSTITTCQTIDHKVITGGLNIKATNGTHPIYGGGLSGEAAATAGACVKITNSIINVRSCSSNCATIGTGYANGATGSTTCFVNNAKSGAHVGCGPVYVADSELIGAKPTGGTCSTTAQCVMAGFTNFNVHAYRVNIHNVTTGGQCEGACEVYDSSLAANLGSADNLTHMDGFISGGNTPSGVGNLAIVLDHNTLSCGSTVNPTDCSGPLGLFGDFSSMSNVTVNHNYFIDAQKASAVCNSYAEKRLVFTNIHFTNNVYDTNCAPGISGHNGVILDWFSGNGNTWCNNLNTDGVRATSPQYAPPNPDQC